MVSWWLCVNHAINGQRIVDVKSRVSTIGSEPLMKTLNKLTSSVWIDVVALQLLLSPVKSYFY